MDIMKLDTHDTDDFKALINIFNEVFENENKRIGEQYISKLLCNPDFFVVVAKVNKKVVGGLSVYILHSYYEEKPMAYIYDVGIAPDFQRKGIGQKLMNFLRDYCLKNGFHDAFVEAELGDHQAVNFYRKTPFSIEMEVMQFTYSFK